MKKTRFVIFMLILATVFCFNACQNDPAQEINEQHNESDVSFKEQLEALPNVISVTDVTYDIGYKGDIYVVNFKSLLDPDSSSDTTFNQRVLIGFSGYDRPNCLVTTGYDLGLKSVISTNEAEIAYLLDGNFVAVEHRYFGDSVPIGKSRSDGNYDGSYWQYLNTKNAAHDVHEIVTQVKTLFTGKWAVTGISKGGLTANLYCYYYPEDVDLTVPYVAPLCKDRTDERLNKFVYEKVGDNDIRYSDGKAAEYRNKLLQLQLWLLERRDELYADGRTFKEQLYYDVITSTNIYHTPYCTPDILFDNAILNFPISAVWQYGDETNCLTVNALVDLSDDAEEQYGGQTIRIKYFYLYNMLKGAPQITNFSTEDYTGYYIQAYTEIGNYSYDYTYLRDAIDDVKLVNPSSNAKITVDSSKENLIFYDSFFSDGELAMQYDDTTYKGLIEWSKTTNEQVIMLYGASDPWYSVRIPDVERPNIHIYVNPKNNHLTRISNFPENQKNEIIELLRQYLE